MAGSTPRETTRDIGKITITARSAASLYLTVHFPNAGERELQALTEVFELVAKGAAEEGQD